MTRTLYHQAMMYLPFITLSSKKPRPYATKFCPMIFMAFLMLLISELGLAQVNLEPEPTVLFEIESDINTASEVDDESPVLSDEEKAAAQARALEISRELDARQLAIENTRSEFGIYSPSLQEAYSDLARFYVELEDYESAINLYNDALQVARINTGLYSEAQRPLIDSLITSQSAVKAWEEVDKLQQLDYFVASRIYSPNVENYRIAMESYGAWKLRVIRENVLSMNTRSRMDVATQLSQFYSREISKIEVQPEVQVESLLPMIQAKTETDLSLARSIASTPFTAFQGNASPYVTETRCQNRPNAQGQLVRQCVNVQVENPRYRQSQRDAKNMALRRYTKEINNSIDRLRVINASSRQLSEKEKQQLDSTIAQLETENIQLTRSGRRLFSF